MIVPYITGKDMVQGTAGAPGAFIISFGTRSFEEAAAFREPFQVLIDRVKEYRESLTGQIHERDYWKFWDKREEFFERMSGRTRILACPSTSKFLIVSFIEMGWIASHSIKMFAFSDFGALALMQSSIHEAWARAMSGKLRIHLAYNLSRAFGTFPLLMDRSGLESIGERYSGWRERVGKERGLCLTDVYNLVHSKSESSSDIKKLRELHVEIDNTVAAAYGWTDLDLGHRFDDTAQDLCFGISEPARREVLSRLLKLNHERYAEEVAQGLHDKKGKPKATGRKGKRTPSDEESLLF